VKRRVILAPPPSPTSKFAPEPALDDSVYQEILKVIHDLGVEMERHPSLYKDKGEEALRDCFLMFLAPHFDSTTGETFNKKGKTDILIRHDKSNLFVAECKFWEGQKLFHKTIDQLLSYLTWRDSKAALIIFVNNKELSPVLKTIEDETPHHPCFVKSKGKVKEGWFSYELHLPGDQNRHVQVAALVFHFP
jgi:hypothetical protein